MNRRDRPLLSFTDRLSGGDRYLIFDLLCDGRPNSGIVFRFRGKACAYLNQCVHMPRQLNCERDTVFDEKNRLLRCSMHGFVYDPVTGESLSTLCQGQRLRALRLHQVDGRIVVIDKRAAPLPQPAR